MFFLQWSNCTLFARVTVARECQCTTRQFCHRGVQRFLFIVDVFNKCEAEASGKPADYIQQFARADPTKWGVSLCTIDGQRFSVGDTDERFSMQLVSKPFTYGLCMKDLGCDEVMKYEILMDHNNKPHNLMVSSGAIVSAALLLYKVQPEL